jgi:thiamine biosynthesis lipoprotein
MDMNDKNAKNSGLDLQLSGDDWLRAHDIHRFSHAAMATTFEIFIANGDKNYAAQAAQAAFTLLDGLEQELSRFIDNSDISRINHLSNNQSIIIGPDAFDCLEACIHLYEVTDGAFDISAGPLIDLWRNKEKYQPQDFELQREMHTAKKSLENLRIIRIRHEVYLLDDTIFLDLGGYGKGYAIDQIANLLSDWSIRQTLIHGGRSTVLALDAPGGLDGWPISISHPQNPDQIIETQSLKYRSLSGSGIKKGAHILDPISGYPVEDKLGAWAGAPSAALSDALSTSFMIMSPPAIEEYIGTHAGVSALLILPRDNPPGDEILRFDP